jgi:choline transport protein
MCVWLVFYCFPYVYPTDAADMNYSSLMAGGLTIIIGGIWAWCRKGYVSPPVLLKVE